MYILAGYKISFDVYYLKFAFINLHFYRWIVQWKLPCVPRMKSLDTPHSNSFITNIPKLSVTNRLETYSPCSLL